MSWLEKELGRQKQQWWGWGRAVDASRSRCPWQVSSGIFHGFQTIPLLPLSKINVCRMSSSEVHILYCRVKTHCQLPGGLVSGSCSPQAILDQTPGKASCCPRDDGTRGLSLLAPGQPAGCQRQCSCKNSAVTDFRKGQRGRVKIEGDKRERRERGRERKKRGENE
jgi:hypothetical protein